MKDLSSEISCLMQAKDFDRVVQVFLKNNKTELPPNLLVAKSMAIQLADNSQPYSLDDARDSLLAAIALDPKHADAWNDLGYFYFAINDDANAAIKCFEQALLISQELYKSSLFGLAKALAEIGEVKRAITILESPRNVANSPEIVEFRQEILDSMDNRGQATID